MTNDDRFRPEGQQPPNDQEPVPSPQGGWSGGSPHTGQGPTGDGQHPAQHSGQSPQTGDFQQGGYQQPAASSGWTGGSPQTGQFQQGPPTGQYGNNPTSTWPAGSYPPGGSGSPGGYPPADYQPYPPKKNRRSIVIIAVLLILVLVLVGLGVWWWIGRSGDTEAADGAETAEDAVTTFVDRFNGDDFAQVYESLSPSEQEYASAMTALLLRYTWTTGQSVEIDEEEAQAELFEALGRYSEVVDYSMSVGSYEEVRLTDGMTGFAITDGSLTVEITDHDEFAQITGDLISEMYTDEQLQGVFGVSGVDEMVRLLEDELLENAQGPMTVDMSDGMPLILVTVQEEKGWYISPVASTVAFMNTEFFVDEDYRQAFISRNGDFTMSVPEPSATPEEAAEAFADALRSKSMVDTLGHLPLAEQRAIGLLIYLSEIPQFNELGLGDLVVLSNLVTTTIDISDHSALTIIDSLILDVSPAIAGSGMQIVIEDEHLTIGTCEPVDIGILVDPDNPVLAFAVVEDESGWNVSLLGTFLNITGAVAAGSDNINEYEILVEQLSGCSF